MRVRIDPERPAPRKLARAIEALQRDQVILYPTDTGDDARAWSRIVIHAESSQRREFQEGAARVQQGLDSLTRQQLAALGVLAAGFFTAAGSDLLRL